MFERTKVDNSQVQVGVPVEITRDDGQVDKGKLLIAMSARVADVLNGPLQYLEFEDYQGRRTLICKSALQAVRVIEIPGAANLSARSRDGEFDPYRVLGLEPAASWEEVKTAYHAQSKIYHPDRYATAELPREVRDYLAAMARRINAAFAALEPSVLARREAAKLRQAPIYSSPGR